MKKLILLFFIITSCSAPYKVDKIEELPFKMRRPTHVSIIDQSFVIRNPIELNTEDEVEREKICNELTFSYSFYGKTVTLPIGKDGKCFAFLNLGKIDYDKPIPFPVTYDILYTNPKTNEKYSVFASLFFNYPPSRTIEIDYYYLGYISSTMDSMVKVYKDKFATSEEKRLWDIPFYAKDSLGIDRKINKGNYGYIAVRNSINTSRFLLSINHDADTKMDYIYCYPSSYIYEKFYFERQSDRFLIKLMDVRLMKEREYTFFGIHDYAENSMIFSTSLGDAGLISNESMLKYSKYMDFVRKEYGNNQE